MPQSQTADQPRAPQGKDRTQIAATQSKATYYLFLNKMIAKLEWTPKTTPQNRPNSKPPHTMGATANNE